MGILGTCDAEMRRKVLAAALAVALYRSRSQGPSAAPSEAVRNGTSADPSPEAALPPKGRCSTSTRAVAANSALWLVQVLLHVQTGAATEAAESFDLRLAALHKTDQGGCANFVRALCELAFQDAGAGQRMLALVPALLEVNAGLLASTALHVTASRLRAWTAASVGGFEQGTGELAQEPRGAVDYRVLDNAYYCLRAAEAATAVTPPGDRAQLAPLLLELQLVCAADERLRLPLLFTMHISDAAKMRAD